MPHRIEIAPHGLPEQFAGIRQRSLSLCQPLTPEDHVPQPADFVSPPKWHLAHTSWFFEALALPKLEPEQVPFHPRYGYLFNSYYESIGPSACRQPNAKLAGARSGP
jgi:hypothetical protein